MMYKRCIIFCFAIFIALPVLSWAQAEDPVPVTVEEEYNTRRPK